MEKLASLSAFFPFWNEEDNIEKVITQAVVEVKKSAKKWEVIIVDDGSTDKTLEKAEKLAKKNKKITVISHTPNRGYGSALKEGLTKARYDYVVFTDGDAQFDFSQLDRFIKKIKQADIVIGYRKKRRDKPVRHILMYLLKLWDFVLFGFHFKDIDCGFKMFKKEALNKLMPLRSEGAMITTEILAKAKRKKLIIKEVEVDHYPRQYGQQSGGNLYVVVRAVLESLILWWDLRNGRF